MLLGETSNCVLHHNFECKINWYYSKGLWVFFLYMSVLHTNTCKDAFSHKLHSQSANSFHVTVQQPEEQLTGKLLLQAETINVITMQKFAYGECCT